MAIEYEDEGRVLRISEFGGYDLTAFSDLSIVINERGSSASYEFIEEEWEELILFMQKQLKEYKEKFERLWDERK